jgi:beta-aspartyl-dipeptidase (metallo-type)
MEKEIVLTLIENGELYTPEPAGNGSVLIVAGKIVRVGAIDRRGVEALGIEVDRIDAAGCIVTPGLIDPHQHLLGGSGEQGFSTQTPEIFLHELLAAGVTSVVGCLGVDTTMKTMAGLLAKAKGLRSEGIAASIYTGGYTIPPTTIMSSVRDDIMFIDEVVGAGEIAIADERCTEASPRELARVVSDAHIGGMLSGKAGITHIHVGPGRRRMEILRAILDEHNIAPEWIYPTHIGRSRELMEEAVAIAGRGATVDIDTADAGLARWLRMFLDLGGDPARLTISSDASITPPALRYEQLRDCILHHDFSIGTMLPLVTSNVARVLKLESKGRLAEGMDGDIMIARNDTLEIVHLLSGGRRMIADGSIAAREHFLKESSRHITLDGAKR